MSAATHLGRYEILNRLGQGAMGAVYRARDPVLDRTVAIKTINPALLAGDDLREEFLERFTREARAAGRLSHPNIVSVFDLGLDQATATPFIVMEYVPGASLEAVLKENPILPLVQAMEIVEQVGAALEEAHGNGIVHRDIKPANIFVDDRGRVKVGDFGVARLDGSELTQTGVRVGTPGYTAPEVLQGAVADARADVFALGVLAYRLFTGKRPFCGTVPEALALDILQREPDPPRMVRPELAERISAAVMRALAKSPAARTPRARALLDELQGTDNQSRQPTLLDPPYTVTERQPVAMAMPTRTGRAQQIVKPTFRRLPVAVIVTALLGLGVGGYLVVRAMSGRTPGSPAAVPITVAASNAPRPAKPAAARGGAAPADRDAARNPSDLERARDLVRDAEELWSEVRESAGSTRDQETKDQQKGRGRSKKDRKR